MTMPDLVKYFLMLWNYKHGFTSANKESCGKFSSKDVLKYDIHEKGRLSK